MLALLPKQRHRPLPSAWRSIIDRNVPAAARLRGADRETHEQLVRRFLRRKRFEGARGFEITDEIRVTIAAQATLLVLGRDVPLFPQVRTIIVYPDRYVATPPASMHVQGVVQSGPQVRAGEAWQGPGIGRTIVLSWADALRGARDPGDGRNVILHEFAHALDAESGVVDGTPALRRRGMFAPWRDVAARELAGLRRAVHFGVPTLLGAYAATNAAEFFAVSTERFFERPHELRAHHPELYEQFMGYYERDPSA